MNPINSFSKKVAHFFKANPFARNVTILAGGTGLAQILIIGTSPLITRLYTPHDFGTLAIFIAVLATFGSATSLKYQLAIPLPEKDEDAIQLLALSLFINIVYGCTVGLLLYVSIPLIEQFENFRVILPFIWIFPISIIALGFYQSFAYWTIRERKFKHIARTKVSQNIALVGTQIGMGLLSTGPIGLLVGDAIGRSGGSISLAIQAWGKVKTLREEITYRRIKVQAVRYRRFPLYSSGSGILNSLGLQLTPLLMAGILGPVVAGLYALTQRVSGAPMKLIGESYSAVYYKEAADALNISKEKLQSLFLKQSRNLLLIGIIPVSILILLGSDGFSFIFGENWKESGLYAQLLSPMILLQFVVVPLSQTLNILERQDLQLLWDTARFVSIVILFGVLYSFSIQEPIAILWISLTMTFLYGILYSITYWQLKKHTSMSSRTN